MWISLDQENINHFSGKNFSFYMDEKVHSYNLWMLEQNSEHLTIQFLPRSASSQTNHF